MQVRVVAESARNGLKFFHAGWAMGFASEGYPVAETLFRLNM